MCWIDEKIGFFFKSEQNDVSKNMLFHILSLNVRSQMVCPCVFMSNCKERQGCMFLQRRGSVCLKGVCVCVCVLMHM